MVNVRGVGLQICVGDERERQRDRQRDRQREREGGGGADRQTAR